MRNIELWFKKLFNDWDLYRYKAGDSDVVLYAPGMENIPKLTITYRRPSTNNVARNYLDEIVVKFENPTGSFNQDFTIDRYKRTVNIKATTKGYELVS